MRGGYLFVVPPPEASISGGNLYNLGLTRALRDAGIDLSLVALDGAERALHDGFAACLVDSLYLDHLPRLHQASAGAVVYLLAHYLPSLVTRGGVPTARELSDPERAALDAADGFLAPSAFMARALAQLSPRARPMLIVEPAIQVDPAPSAPQHERLHAVLVANLVPGKGVLPFLEALIPHLRDGVRLRLTVIGSLQSDPRHAAACRSLVSSEPLLAAAVQLAGPLAHPAMLDAVRASDLFVSASRMESFGLALAEARALGVPIVARDGGNVAAHVEESAGGRLLVTDAALAAECALLAGDALELARRRRAAQAARRPRRSWADAARDFVSAFSGATENASE